MWVLVAFSLAVIALLLWNSPTQSLLVSGVVFTALGGLSFAAAAIAAWFHGLWVTVVGGSVVGILIGNALTAGLIPGGILLVLGVLSLVGRGLILKSRKKLAVV